MVGSLLVFAFGKPFYAKETKSPRTRLSREERRQRWRTLRQLFGVFGLFVFFWVAYEHADSIWVYFARDYVNLKLPFIGKMIAPDQPQLVNPLCVLLLVPLFGWAFRKLDPSGRVTTPHRKIFVGFLFSAAAPACMAMAALVAHHSGARVSLWWLVGAYVLLTIGEVLLYATALELAYSVAPKSMKSFITACFLLTDTLGNFVNVWFSPLYGGSLTDPVSQRGPLSPVTFFGITTGMVLVAAIAFLFVGRGIGRREAPAA
jgi:POT family proton-dependent oligopeptide transporter